MAATIKSKRVAEFKAIYQKELGTFWTKYAALFGLLGMNTLSLVNRRWVEKRLNEMHAMFAGNSEQLAKLDELNLRNEAAKIRYAARLEKKKAKKSKKKDDKKAKKAEKSGKKKHVSAVKVGSSGSIESSHC